MMVQIISSEFVYWLQQVKINFITVIFSDTPVCKFLITHLITNTASTSLRFHKKSV